MPATASSRSASASMAGATRRKRLTSSSQRASSSAARADSVWRWCRSTSSRSPRADGHQGRASTGLAEPSVERAVTVEHVRIAARHARTEVQPDVAEHDHRAGSHVLAAVIPDALDDGHGPGVADGEALPAEPRRRARHRSRRRAPRCRRGTARRRREAGRSRSAPRSSPCRRRRSPHRRGRARPRGEERAEALSGGALEAHRAPGAVATRLGR